MSATDADSRHNCAVLIRRNKPSWTFAYDPKIGALVHRTKTRTYAILHSANCKPFWVALLQDDNWLTVENVLCAVSIEFDNGGRYLFPERLR